jgi:hypothetical protein
MYRDIIHSRMRKITHLQISKYEETRVQFFITCYQTAKRCHRTNRRICQRKWNRTCLHKWSVHISINGPYMAAYMAAYEYGKNTTLRLINLVLLELL